MTKGRILTTLLLMAVLGIFGAVYQLYFKEKLEMYSRDQELLTALEGAYKNLSTTFSGYRPDVLTEAWRAQRLPWTEAVTERTKFFNLGGWYAHERPPENVPILRFWYGDAANKQINDVYQKLGNSANLGYGRFPMDLYTTFGVPRMEDYSGYNVRRPEVNRALGRLAFGISAMEMLADANASLISEIVIWPNQEKPEHSGLLISRTVGFSFSISMEDLVTLLEKLRTEERYFSVDAIQMDYPYILYPQEPQLQVKMLLTQVTAKPKPAGAAPGAAPGAAALAAAPTTLAAAAGPRSAQQLFQLEGFDRNRAVKVEEPGFFSKAWKWFKRFYLYSN